MSATALTSSILSQHSLIKWHEDLKFWREKHLAGVASKSYTSRRRATRRVEELHVASKRPRYARRVEEVRTTRRRGTHDASKRYARRVEKLHYEYARRVEKTHNLAERNILVRVLCPDIFQFHCACLRTEICLRELALSRTLNPNPTSSRSVDPQFSHKLLFYVH